MHSAKTEPLAEHRIAGAGASVDPAALLVRLRRTTADAHTRVEERLFPSALADRASYSAMLQVLLALHEPLEAQLAADRRLVDGFAALGVDLVTRRKATRLRADLAALGSVPEPAEPSDGRRAAHPPVGDLPAALGAFYVLEGSTLGGRVLLAEVRERLGPVPAAFFAGYGDDTGRYWRRTRAALIAGVTSAADPQDAADRLVAGASDTFRHLDRLLDDAGWPEPVRSATVPEGPGGEGVPS